MKVTPKQLLAPAVLAYLFVGGGLPRLSVTLAESIMRAWGMDHEQIDKLHLCAAPSYIQNFMVAETCARRFGSLEGIEPFYRCRGIWRLDIDENEVVPGRGFLMPVTHPKHRWIDRMVAFRGPSDKHGFPVKVRKELRAAA